LRCKEKNSKCSILFRIEEKTGPKGEDQIKMYQVTDGFFSEINDKTETITIKETSIDNNRQLIGTPQNLVIDQATQSLLVGKYFYGPVKQFTTAKTLKVIDSKFALQTLAIAFKQRPSITISSTKVDEITEAGSTFGFAPGWKFNYTWFSGKKNIFGQFFNRLSVTPGMVVGFGTSDLKKGVSAYTLDKKEPILTTGGYLMIGFNNVNIGLVVGNDRSIGKSGTDWYYNKKWWKGIAVGLDLIK